MAHLSVGPTTFACMTLTLAMITMDTSDAESLAQWWAEQTGAEITQTNEGWFVIVKGGTLPVLLAFQKVGDPTPGKNRIHLDLTTPDLDAEVDRLVAAGATLVERRGDESFHWVTLADPQGNQFCVAGQQEATEEL
jgi:predicted enzyme related to lactoylglutathione lyase